MKERRRDVGVFLWTYGGVAAKKKDKPREEREC